MAVIQAHGITHVYGGTFKVLDDVSLSIEKGEFVSILGASGSGKTTLISILSGLECPTVGYVSLNGREITSMKERDLAILRRTEISYVFQFFNLAPYLTAEQNILVPVLLNGKRKSSVVGSLNKLMELMNITHCKDLLPDKLSGGEQQRVAIARGLIINPEILFLDEPTGNLDSKNAEDIMKLLVKINAEYGTTVIQVTHSEKNALYGSRIITLSDGKITSQYINKTAPTENAEI